MINDEGIRKCGRCFLPFPTVLDRDTLEKAGWHFGTQLEEVDNDHLGDVSDDNCPSCWVETQRIHAKAHREIEASKQIHRAYPRRAQR
jgi:hypothetical protein